MHNCGQPSTNSRRERYACEFMQVSSPPPVWSTNKFHNHHTAPQRCRCALNLQDNSSRPTRNKMVNNDEPDVESRKPKAESRKPHTRVERLEQLGPERESPTKNTNERTNERTNEEQTNEQTNKRTNERTNERSNDPTIDLSMSTASRNSRKTHTVHYSHASSQYSKYPMMPASSHLKHDDTQMHCT